MKILSVLYYLFIRIREIVYEKRLTFRIVNTHVGYKFINVLLIRSPFLEELTGEVHILKPEQLFLSIDYLRDKYTLLDCNIKDSPHYGLMKALLEGDSISETDYIKRARKGTLDSRFLSGYVDEDYYRENFYRRKNQIESGDQTPIKVFKVNDRYYIKDGKHRAALCSLLGFPIYGVELDPMGMFGGIGKQIITHMDGRKSYSKHLLFYKKIADTIKNGKS